MDKSLFVQVRRPTEQDIAILVDLAKEDNHSIICPTHCVLKNEQLIGYVSMGVIPTVLLWLDTKRALVRDSRTVMNFIENAVVDRGGTYVNVPCNEDSPFRPYMERLGFVDIKMGTFVKQLLT
jgi:hypothetical protein